MKLNLKKKMMMDIRCVLSFSMVSFLLLYSTICSCVLVFWFSCQYLSSDWRETPVMTPLCSEEITYTKPRWKRLSVLFLLFCLFMLLCVIPPALH